MKISTSIVSRIGGRKASLMLTLCCVAALSATAQAGEPLTVPGTVEAEDLDATDYYFQQTDAVAANHSIRPDVDVAIADRGGVIRIGNTTVGDYFTYTLNVTQSGRYKVVGHVSTGGSRGGYTLSFDLGTDNAKDYKAEFPKAEVEGSTNPWNDYTECVTERVNLTEGTHKMRVTVDKPLNIDKFDFIRVADIPEGINPDAIINDVPGQFLGGDMDCTEGSYYSKQFENGGLRNEYQANPNVRARIKANGVLGNTSAGDFYTYILNVTESASYTVALTGEAPENGKGTVKLIFDGGNELTGTVSGQGWNVPVEQNCGTVDLTAGYHTMRMEILSGINIDSFKFTKSGTTGIETIVTDSSKKVDVYSIDGRYLRSGSNDAEILNGLDRGIYIVGGKKILKAN